MAERGKQGDLDEDQQRILRALYCLRSIDNPEKLLRGLLKRRDDEEE